MKPVIDLVYGSRPTPLVGSTCAREQIVVDGCDVSSASAATVPQDDRYGDVSSVGTGNARPANCKRQPLVPV